MVDNSWNGKSVEKLTEEANRSLSASEEMSEQEIIEYDAEYGYATDETQPNAEGKGSAKMDEMNVRQIGNADIGKLRHDEIMFVGLGEGGAMGEPGVVNIITVSHGKAKISHANYCFGDFDMDKFAEVFTPLKSFDCGIFGEVSGIAEGWHHIYMGMGNHLFVRDTVYPAFSAAIDGKSESEIYCCYMDKAGEIIAQMKGGK